MTNKYNSLLKTLKKTEYSLDKSIVNNHCVDWRGNYRGSSEIIFFPKSLTSIQKIVRFCFKKNIPIVPQGGNTGLVGGSVPRFNKGEIIINLCKLNNIREIDIVSNTITVESGCILQSVNDRLEPHNLQMPISLGSKGSCQIGGNIATNAGGLNVIKFGSIRNNILGIEAILPNGEFYDDLKTVKKNNTGFDIKQLLIGSEGTLGIITAATFQIHKKTNDRVVIIICLKNFNHVLNIYQKFISSFGEFITAFELMNEFSMNLAQKFNRSMKLPFTGNYYCLVELTNFIGIENFIFESSKALKKYNPNISIINFGHLGDNNLHFNVCIDDQLNKKNYSSFKKKVNEIIFSFVNKFNGSISAEHGIGQLRKNELKRYKSAEEIKRMKKIKKIFDPKNIMNPGKVI